MTPREFGRFFELVYRKELWSTEFSDLALEILGNQQYTTLLTKYLPQYFWDSENTGDEELVRLATKSGAMDECRNDGGLVLAPRGCIYRVEPPVEFECTWNTAAMAEVCSWMPNARRTAERTTTHTCDNYIDAFEGFIVQIALAHTVAPPGYL